jgi:hypothetical protein
MWSRRCHHRRPLTRQPPPPEGRCRRCRAWAGPQTGRDRCRSWPPAPALGRCRLFGTGDGLHPGIRGEEKNEDLQRHIADTGDVVTPVLREEGDIAGTDGDGLQVAVGSHEADLDVAADEIVQLAGIGMPVRLAQTTGAKMLRGESGHPARAGTARWSPSAPSPRGTGPVRSPPARRQTVACRRRRPLWTQEGWRERRGRPRRSVWSPSRSGSDPSVPRQPSGDRPRRCRRRDGAGRRGASGARNQGASRARRDLQAQPVTSFHPVSPEVLSFRSLRRSSFRYPQTRSLVFQPCDESQRRPIRSGRRLTRQHASSRGEADPTERRRLPVPD